MSSSPAIDTSTISPLVVPTKPSGYSPASSTRSDHVPPMTLPPNQAAALESASIDSIPTPLATLPTISPPVSDQLPATTPSAPSLQPVVIPDVVSMETDLRTKDPLSPKTATTSSIPAALSHLQPNNLIQTPDGPKVTIAPVPVSSPAQSIQLASTAPALKSPTLTQVVYQAKAQKEQTNPAHHYIISGILIVLTVVSVSVLALFLIQQYQISQAEAAALGTTKTTLLDFVIERLPFVTHDSDSLNPEAVWYQ